jgi:hypothetical protein
MPDLDQTEYYDSSPAVKYLLGRAILQPAGLSAGLDNPKFVLSVGTAVESPGSGYLLVDEWAISPADAVLTIGTAPPQVSVQRSEVQRITIRSASASNSPRAALVASTWARRSKNVQEFRTYVERVTTRGLVAEKTGREALSVWDSLNSATSSAIGVPNTAPGDNGQLLLVWELGQHHLEIEFAPGVTPIVFYANRTAPNASWELDFTRDALLNETVLKTLAIFSEQTNA